MRMDQCLLLSNFFLLKASLRCILVSCRKNMENDPARGVYLWSSQCHWPIMTLWHLQPHELQMLYSWCVQHPKRHPTNFTPQTPLSSQLVKSYANFLRATCFWTPCSYLIARANARIHPRAATQMFLTLTLGLWRTVLSNLVNSTPVAKPVTWNEMDQISFTTKYRDRTHSAKKLFTYKIWGYSIPWLVIQNIKVLCLKSLSRWNTFRSAMVYQIDCRDPACSCWTH